MTWPRYEVIGILESPTWYNSERYDWFAGFEIAPEAGGNTIYINYEKARNEVFVDFRGSDINNDLISSILVKCDNPENISSIRSALTNNLTIQIGGGWSIIDLKSLSLEMRKYVYSWYFWINEGADQEQVLATIQDYMQNEGYIVVFGFTQDFVRATFGTMIDLIRFITYGMLVLAILISMIGLGLHCLLTTMARRREIGMLRSIGLDKRGVIRSISGETLIIASLGVIAGIFAGLLQGSLMVLALPAKGFIAVTMSFPWVTIISLVAITFIAAIGSSIIPAKWAANINIIDAVRTR
ncbi:MAG: ABC transporter permease [Candidatus Hodarchaeales archaeon]